MWRLLSDLKNPHQSILILTLHNGADTVSGAGSLTHLSKRLKVGIRSEISWVNEALLHIRRVPWCRNGLGSIPAGQVPDKNVSVEREKQMKWAGLRVSVSVWDTKLWLTAFMWYGMGHWQMTSSVGHEHVCGSDVAWWMAMQVEALCRTGQIHHTSYQLGEVWWTI